MPVPHAAHAEAEAELMPKLSTHFMGFFYCPYLASQSGRRSEHSFYLLLTGNDLHSVFMV